MSNYNLYLFVLFLTYAACTQDRGKGLQSEHQTIRQDTWVGQIKYGS